MPTHTALSTLDSNTDKGRKATDLFRAAYDKVGLDETRAQFLNENKAFPAALRELINEFSMTVKAPEGGRLHIVRVSVNPARPWQEAIDAAGPDTGKDWDVRKVGDHYPPEAGKPEVREIILVNFGKTIPDTQYALDWAKPYGLSPEKPRGVFAIGEYKPQLHRDLVLSAMAVISPVPCSFEGERRVPYVWWRDTKRFAYLDWFDNDWGDYCWFAFVRE